MATHYIENGSGGNQYYFDSNGNTPSQQPQRAAQDRAYASPIASTVSAGASDYSSYPAGVAGARSPHPQVRSDRNAYNDNEQYQLPAQHQSVAGFNKSAPPPQQQQYQTPPSPVPQVRATVRAVSSHDQQFSSSSQYAPQQYQQARQQQPSYGNYEQQGAAQSPQVSPQYRAQPQAHPYANYEQQGAPQSPQVSPQYQQYQPDSRQQPTNTPGYYQAPSSSQYPPKELDQRTESPSRGHDQHVQAQRVSVRSMSSSTHQQHESSGAYQQPAASSPSQSSPQQAQANQDQLQQYYSQLTPEQYQQLLRQQQIQRQQQDELRRQQLAQQQYYLEQQQQQYQSGRAGQDAQRYDEYQQQQQQRRGHQVSANQEQQYQQQQGHSQYDPYQQRPQPGQAAASPNSQQERQQQQQHGQQAQLDAYYEQQRRAAAAQQSTSSPNYQQEQYRSNAPGGQQQHPQMSYNQPQRGRTESERQYQDEQEYYAAQLARQQQQEREQAAAEAAQRQQAMQRSQQQQQPQQPVQVIQAEQTPQPVGIRGLMNKFTGPSKIPSVEPKPRTTTTRQFSSSSYSSTTAAGQTTSTTSRSATTHTMTYSALPKPQEPPVNSAEYFRMLQAGNISSTPANIQAAAAPPHIQGPAPGFGALRDRFKAGSFSESSNAPQDPRRQQLQSNPTGSGLSSLRDQYMNRAKESLQSQEESLSQRIQHVSRSIVGGDLPAPAPTQQYQAPPAPLSTPQVSQPEESPVASQSVDDHVASSEGAVADGGSSSGASPLDNDEASPAAATEPAEAPSS